MCVYGYIHVCIYMMSEENLPLPALGESSEPGAFVRDHAQVQINPKHPKQYLPQFPWV